MKSDSHHFSDVNLEQIYFVITRRCNLSCSHCIRSSGPGISDYLGVSDFVMALEKLYPYAKNAQILISGGEPTLHGDFVEMCKKASEIYPDIMVNTNGLRLKYLLDAYEATDKKLKVQISIDGDEEFHDNIRGKGTFQRSLRNINELSKHGVFVVIASTVGKNNFLGIKSLDSVLDDINYAIWTIKREVVFGRATLKNQLDTSSWNNFAKDAKQTFKNTDRLRISTMFDWHNMGKAINRPHKNNIMNCGTGTSKLYINPDLTVFPCGCLEQINLGDLSKDNAQSVILSMLEKIPNKPLNSICQLCPFKTLCNGGCPGSAYNYFGNFYSGDPRCPAIKDLSNKL